MGLQYDVTRHAYVDEINGASVPYDNNLSFRVNHVRLKHGYVGQVWVGNVIVWESKHTSETAEGALTKANKHVHKALKNLLGGK